MKVGTLDIIFALILVVTSFRVAIRGFVAELMSFAAVLLGLGAAVLLSGRLSPLVARFAGESFWNPVIAFLVVFLVVYLAVKLIENALNRLLDRVNLEKLDRALGFFLGLAEGLIIVVLIVFVLRVQRVFDVSGLLSESLFVTVLFPLVPYVRDVFLPGGGAVGNV